MVRQMYANTPAANVEAVLQYRHQPHHGKTVADAGGKLEAIDHVEEAALSSNSSAPHLVEATIDGRSSRAVCLHAAAHWPMPKKIAGGLHCEHTQAWHACNKGFSLPQTSHRRHREEQDCVCHRRRAERRTVVHQQLVCL